MYQSLRSETKSPHHTRRELVQASLVGIILNFLFASSVSVLGVYIFGSKLDKSLIDSFDAEGHEVSSYLCRLTYMIMVIGHLPFIFFAGKESVLIIFEEYKYRSLTLTIDRSLRIHANDKHSIGLDSLGSAFEKKYEQGSILDNMDSTVYNAVTCIIVLFATLGACVIDHPE